MKNKKTIGKAFGLIGLVILLIWAVVLMMPYIADGISYIIWIFMPFIFSYLLSLLVNPMAETLQKRFRLPRGVSAILVIVLTVGVLGGIVFAIVWKIVDEVKNIFADIPMIAESVRMTWYSVTASLSDFVDVLPEAIQDAIDGFGNEMLVWVANLAPDSEFLASAGNVAKKVPSIFISIVVFLLSLYFMVSDATAVSRVVRKPFSQSFIDRITRIKKDIKHYVGGYVKAQLIIMCISFTILFIGLSVLGVDYALVIALITAAFDALPFFGSGAVLWPWAIIAFITGDIITGIGLVIIYLSVILTRQLIEPKIVSKNIGMHPILTLMSMYIGYRMLSIGGMILGPLVLILVVSLYRVGIFDVFIKTVKNLFLKIAREVKDIINSCNDEGEK